MRTYVSLVVFAVLLAVPGCNKYAQNSEGSSGLNRTRLYDFRSQPAAPHAIGDGREQAAVLASLFPTPPDCAASAQPGKAKTPKSRRIAVLADATGAFSAPGQHERALLVGIEPCDGDPQSAAHEIVVVPAAGNTTPVARAEVADDQLLQTFDLSRDGQDEFFLAHNTEKNGVKGIQAQIYQFDKSKLRTLEDFGDVYENDCQAQFSAQGISAAVIDYIPRTEKEALPRFVVQLYRAACPQDAQAPQWQLVSPK